MTTQGNWSHESAPGRASWDRQTSESSKAFASFCQYRNAHPLQRSVARVGQQLGKSVTLLERWSTRFQWVQRAAAFDREEDRLSQARRVRDIEEMNQRHAEIAATALGKVAERLGSLDANSLRPNELARLLEIASRAERMARGVLPDEAVVHQRVSTLNADQIRRHLAEEGLLSAAVFPVDPLLQLVERNR